MKAFAWHDKNVNVSGIVFHETASKARYSVYLSARGVGYLTEFPDIKIKRAPDFDKATSGTGKAPEIGRCYQKQYLQISQI